MTEEGQATQVPHPPENQQILNIAKLEVLAENPKLVVKPVCTELFYLLFTNFIALSSRKLKVSCYRHVARVLVFSFFSILLVGNRLCL